MEYCSGLPDRTTLRRCEARAAHRVDGQNCSGLPDRTTLRPFLMVSRSWRISALFRSSRPDYIETSASKARFLRSCHYCSGLPDRTTLRLSKQPVFCCFTIYCSGLPDRTTLRLDAGQVGDEFGDGLFRSSRPDYIETLDGTTPPARSSPLFRSSRPDYIETSTGPMRWRS